MKTKESTKLNQCMSCPIAHQVISDYMTFYSDYREYQRGNATYDEYLENTEDNVQGIAKTLNFEGSFEEQLDFVLNLSKAKLSKKGLNEDNFECVETIHKIIKSIKRLFFSCPEEYECFIEQCQKQTIEIISIIQTMLNDKAVDIEAEWIKIKKLQERQKLHPDEAENLFNKKYTEYKELIDDYCVKFYNEIPYEYSNSSDSDYRNCKCENFLEYVKKIDNPVIVDFNHERIDKLKAEFQNVVYEFISKTPKRFGELFKRIKKIQNFTDTDITNLLWENPKKGKSIIASLVKSAEPKLTNEQLKKLSRILLVSEDVLKSGAGISYGLWKSTDTLDEISEIISLSDSDFIDRLKEKDIYNQKEICIYPKEDENTKVIYLDYEAMYYTALHPEEIDILISVLEELQAEKNS